MLLENSPVIVNTLLKIIPMEFSGKIMCLKKCNYLLDRVYMGAHHMYIKQNARCFRIFYNCFQMYALPIKADCHYDTTSVPILINPDLHINIWLLLLDYHSRTFRFINKAHTGISD